MEKQISSKTIYDGKVVKLVKDEVSLDDGTTSIREVVMHHGGACIALKNKDDKYFMVRQYRYSVQQEMLEFCAGKLNEGEDPDETVVREAQEELGYKVENLCKLGYIIPTCGYSSERIYLYYGEAGEYVGTNFDTDERIEAESYSLEDIKKMIGDGIINDAKTISIILKMEMKFNGRL